MPEPLLRELHVSPQLRATEYHCRERKGAPAFEEVHRSFTLAFVRKGSFAYSIGGVRHELVAGSIMLGSPGSEYRCAHDHAAGDVCLSFALSPSLLDELVGSKLRVLWSAGALPPVERLMVLGAKAAAAADGACGVSLEEVGYALLGRVIEALGDRPLAGAGASTHSDRRRAVEAAELIETRYAEPLDLETLARELGLSPFHFLRMFSRVLGVTPHQYLLRTRLAAAAQGIAEGERPITEIALEVGFGDMSTFVRTFRRAAGASPRAFRKLDAGDRRKISQVRSSARR